MSNNGNYSYLVTVNPPDNIAKILSAIISFDVYIAPSVNFTLSVNGTPCNTPFYYIATTYASAGQSRITFDCSNVINKSAVYNLTLGVRLANTGSSTGWLDLTYMNKPLGDIQIMGTEYVEGDDGTLFLQVRDADGRAVNNATCYISIFYPNTANSTHPYWIQEAPMRKLNTTSGLFYYDFIAPDTSGLYMTEAECYYITNHTWFYPPYSPLKSNRTVLQGVYTGDTFMLNDYEDWLYTQCDSSGGSTKYCEAYYDWNVDSNITDLAVVYLGSCSVSATMTMYVWNWTNSNWITLPNTLLFHSTASSGAPIGVDEYISNRITNLNNTIAPNNTIRVKTTIAGGSSFKLFSNWLSLDASKTGNFIQDLRGSGEVHVSSASTQVGRFYKILSCDGEMNGKCAVHTNDDEFDLAEGELEDNITIMAMATKPAEIEYTSPFTVDCSALYWIKKWNGTSWDNFESYNTYSTPDLENCRILIHDNITSGYEYSYWLKFDDYITWEIQYSKQIRDAIYANLYPICEGYKVNYTYTVPIVEGMTVNDSTKQGFCHRYYDDIYWFDNYYNLSLEYTIAGDLTSPLVEERFYRGELYDRYLFLQNITVNPNISYIPTVGNVSYVDWVGNIPRNGTGIKYAGGTEYKTNETASFAVQFRKVSSGSPEPINDGVCNATVYYPNKTVWLNEVDMPYLAGSRGIYYYNTTTPSVEGVYTIDMLCSKGGINAYESASFHIAGWANNIFNISNMIASHNATMFNESQTIQNLIRSHNNTMYVAIQALNSTITTYYLSLNSTIYAVKGVVDSIYDWFQYKIAVVS